MTDLIYEAVACAGKSLPLSWLEKAGRMCGLGMWYALPSRRGMACANIRQCLEVTAPQAHRIGLASFRHTGQAFAEIFWGRRANWRWFAQQVRVAQPEIVKRVQASDRPIVATTGHFGAWELMAPVMAMLFEGRPKQVVIRAGRDASMFALLKRLRRRNGIEVLGHRQAAPAVLRQLRRGGVTAFLTDHNTTQKDAAFFPFCGRLAAVNMGPALLALRAKALVWPVYLRREGQGYIFDADTPLDTTTLTGERTERQQAVARFYTQAMEQRVYTYPEQWFWMHNRWKTRPLGERGI